MGERLAVAGMEARAMEERGGVGTDRRVSWLHVSDIHFAGGPAETWHRKHVLDPLVEFLGRERKTGKSWDLMFVTGDIAFSGSEYAPADDFFERLLEAAGLPKSRLFIVPGNHDVDRGTRGGGYPKSADDALSYFAGTLPFRHLNRLREFYLWESGFLGCCRLPPAASTCQPYPVIEIRGVRVGVLGINSALFSREHDRHKLWLGEPCLEAATEELLSHEPDLRIALVHHPLEWLHDQEKSEVTTLLRKHFDIVLSGHLHRPDVAGIVTPAGSTVHLAAGACYTRDRRPECPMCALFCQADYDHHRVSVLPIRYEKGPRRWFPDPSLYPDMPGGEGCLSVDRWKAEPPEEASSRRARAAISSIAGPGIPTFGPPAGRVEAHEKLRRRLSKPGVTVLTGEGGSGKSAFAAAVAQAMSEETGRSPASVAWADCRAEGAFGPCLSDIARTFAESIPAPETGALVESITNSLPESHKLAVFDGFEILLDSDRKPLEPDVIDSLHRLSRQIAVLLVSRVVPEGLRAAVWQVPEITGDEATEFFVERSGRSWSTAQRRQITRLCRAVGNHPLAIELLAGRAAAVPLSELLREAERQLQEDLERCFESSYKPLANDAKKLFREASVLPDGVSPEVVREITKRGLRAAEDLVNASLWRLDNDRYRVNPVIRQFAENKIAGPKKKLQTKKEVARILARVAKTQAAWTAPDERKGTPEGREALDWFAAEWHNLLACAGYAREAGDAATAVDIAEATLDFIIRRGYWKEAEELYSSALESVTQKEPSPKEAILRNHLGVIYQFQDRWDEAIEQLTTSLEIQKKVGLDMLQRARTLNSLGWVHCLVGDYGEAAKALGEALRICKGADGAPYRLEARQTRSNLGVAYQRQGKLDAAEQEFQESLKISDWAREGQTLNRRGALYESKGEWEDAEDALLRSLDILELVKDPFEEGITQRELGNVHRHRAQWEDAEERYRLSLDLLENRSNLETADTYRQLAVLREQQEDLAGAAAMADKALAALRHCRPRGPSVRKLSTLLYRIRARARSSAGTASPQTRRSRAA